MTEPTLYRKLRLQEAMPSKASHERSGISDVVGAISQDADYEVSHHVRDRVAFLTGQTTAIVWEVPE